MEEEKSKMKTIMKVVVGMVALIVAVLVIFIIRKEFILKDLDIKAEETEKIANYHVKILEEGTQGKSTEAWVKDSEHYFVKITMQVNDDLTVILYRNGDEQLQITDGMRTEKLP